MKLKVIVLIVMCAFFSGVKSQENTTYFFMGHVFSIDEKGEEIRHPYLPVLLAYKDKPEDVVAVRLTNMVGIVSFKEIPIYIKIIYLLSYFLKENENSSSPKIPQRLASKVGITIHIYNLTERLVNTTIKKSKRWKKERRR